MKDAMRGFTLLEVLLAIGLLALLLLLVASAVTATRRALSSSEALTTRLDEVRTAQLFLRRELQQILPLPLSEQTQGTPAVFYGEAHEMRYIAALPAHWGGGLFEQRVGLGNTQAQPWLQVAFTQLTGSSAGRAWGEPQQLMRQVRQLRLAYRGLDPQGAPTPWLPRWPWPERLPRQIEVNLESPGPVSWPPLRVALRLEPQALAVGAP